MWHVTTNAQRHDSLTDLTAKRFHIKCGAHSYEAHVNRYLICRTYILPEILYVKRDGTGYQSRVAIKLNLEILIFYSIFWKSESFETDLW